MASLGAFRLRDLIAAVRQCKTLAEERALINRESAFIREAFRENRPFLRTRNMLKLLYISMLGYPTEFGQVEVVNLLAQAEYSGKRIGYLTLQMVLDENDEVLTLSENHLKKDLANGIPLIQAMALGVVANIASEVMARDMLDEVSRLILSSNNYLKNKACLAAIRIVKKIPDYAEVFLESPLGLFKDHMSGTLLCEITLINECLKQPNTERFLSKYRHMTNAAVRVLKQLILSSRVTDQDVSGVCDPFLQVKILEFMRLVGKDSSVTSEALNDVLAQVLTNTDGNRNSGCAVQYECVKTIHAIQADEALRTLAVNTVVRFLTAIDNNLRFVALETLLDYASRDADAVRRHQAIILDCLKDVDISIRRRALGLTVALVDLNNVRLLVPDLLTYLTVCAEEIREDVTLFLCRIIEKTSPSSEWRVEISLRFLRLAKQHAPVDFATRFIGVLSNESEEVQTSAVLSMWDEASYPFDALHQSRKAFLAAAIWGLGEFVDLLMKSKHVKPEDVATCIAEIVNNTSYDIIKRYGLTAMMKIASNYPQVNCIALHLFENYSTSMDCELQQRASEYATLLQKFPEEAAFSFTRMPPICPADNDAEVEPVQVVNVSPEVLRKQEAVALDSLFDAAGSGPSHSLFQSDSQSRPPPRSRGAAAADLDDLFGPSPSLAPPPPPPPPPPTAGHRVFECADLEVSVAGAVEGAVVSASVTVASRIAIALEGLSFQVAVPKKATVNMEPLPSTVIPAHGKIVQRLTVDNSNTGKNPHLLMLRIKLLYSVGGEERTQLMQVSQEL